MYYTVLKSRHIAPNKLSVSYILHASTSIHYFTPSLYFYDNSQAQ